MNSDTPLYRQVPQNWIAEDGTPTRQNFSPSMRQGSYELSLANGDDVTPEEAQADHIAAGYQSEAVIVLRVSVFTELGLKPVQDGEPIAYHVAVKLPQDGKRRREIANALMQKYKWAIPPPPDNGTR